MLENVHIRDNKTKQTRVRLPPGLQRNIMTSELGIHIKSTWSIETPSARGSLSDPRLTAAEGTEDGLMRGSTDGSRLPLSVVWVGREAPVVWRGGEHKARLPQKKIQPLGMSDEAALADSAPGL